MGASGWDYFVPYQSDINAALQTLRQQAFQNKDFETWFDEDEGIEPADIDELLELNAEAGAHSIIDMTEGVSKEPAFGTVSPLTEPELMKLFGTLEPNHDT